MILGILFLVNLPKTMKIVLHENKFFDNWFYSNWSICFITKWFKIAFMNIWTPNKSFLHKTAHLIFRGIFVNVKQILVSDIFVGHTKQVIFVLKF
jgi:hypothetical protein